MKKIISLFLSVMVFLSITEGLDFSVFAGELRYGTFNGFKYAYYEGTTSPNNYDSIYDYTGDETDVVIPASIDGHLIQEISLAAFKDCTNIKSIKIPASIKVIGESAFENCTGLTSIELPSVDRIEFEAFKGCSNLKIAYLPCWVNILKQKSYSYDRGHIFENCINLETIVYTCSQNNNLAYIAEAKYTSPSQDGYNEGYGNNNSIKRIIIQEGVKEIRDSAFEDCNALEYVSIPNTVTSIGSYVFCNCTALSNITIPNSVTIIGTLAFENCTSLSSFTIPISVTKLSGYVFKNTGYYNNETNWVDGSLYKDNCLIGCDDTISENYIVKENTRVIDSCAFDDARQQIKSITFPKSMRSIPKGLLGGLENLSSVTIPKSIKRIEMNNFYYLDNFSEVYYLGSKEQWNKIIIEGNNNELEERATFHFFNEPDLTGWQNISGKWKYYDNEENPVIGWQKIGSTWYYFQSSGAMKTGWLKDGGKWYYFESSGAMLANTSKNINGKTYKFNSSGQCTNP